MVYAGSDETNDEELAHAVQQGSRAALRCLVIRHQGPLLGFLYRMSGGDRALAEDLVQETMTRLLRGIHTYEAKRPFKPWLYQIAVNVARDYYKQADMRHTVSDNGTMARLAGPLPPETAVIQQEKIDEAVAAVYRLPAHQRETLLLRYGQELSLQEIADILDIPVGTVKSRLSLALKRLRAQLVSEASGQV